MIVRKYLPIILLLAGILVLVGAYFFVFRKGSTKNLEEDITVLPEVSLADRPFTTLTPSSDGHWLKLNVKKIKISADSLDYELLYTLPDGRTQGVPGTVKLSEISEVERDLLLGSESSGKYKYDEGVKEGTITLRFRNGQGKLVAKFSTDFHLLSNTRDLTSADGKFSYKLDKSASKEFLIVMETFGYPGNAPGEVKSGPYGVFKGVAKITTARGVLPMTTAVFPGTVSLSGTLYRASGSGWDKLTDGKSQDVGIFIATTN